MTDEVFEKANDIKKELSELEKVVDYLRGDTVALEIFLRKPKGLFLELVADSWLGSTFRSLQSVNVSGIESLLMETLERRIQELESEFERLGD